MAQPEHVAELVHRDPDAERRRAPVIAGLSITVTRPSRGRPMADDRPRQPRPAALAQPRGVGDEDDVGAAPVGRANDPHARARPVPARGRRIHGGARAGGVEVRHAPSGQGFGPAGRQHGQLAPGERRQPERERGEDREGEPRASAPQPPQVAADDDHLESWKPAARTCLSRCAERAHQVAPGVMCIPRTHARQTTPVGTSELACLPASARPRSSRPAAAPRRPAGGDRRLGRLTSPSARGTGSFLEPLDDAGEPDDQPPLRLAVSGDIDRLVGQDTQRPRRSGSRAPRPSSSSPRLALSSGRASARAQPGA